MLQAVRGAAAEKEATGGEEVDAARELYLLTNTQAYLEIRSVGGEPDATLVAAWDEFSRVFGQRMLHSAIGCGVQRDDADDVVQNAWIHVCRKLPQFHYDPTQPRLGAWFVTVIHHESVTHFRRVKRHRARRLDDAIEAGAEPADRHAGPADECERRLQRVRLERAIAQLGSQLSTTSHAVLRLRVLHDRSVAEIAAELAISPREVSWRLCRAVPQLRTRLQVIAN